MGRINLLMFDVTVQQGWPGKCLGLFIVPARSACVCVCGGGAGSSDDQLAHWPVFWMWEKRAGTWSAMGFTRRSDISDTASSRETESGIFWLKTLPLGPSKFTGGQSRWYNKAAGEYATYQWVNVFSIEQTRNVCTLLQVQDLVFAVLKAVPLLLTLVRLSSLNTAGNSLICCGLRLLITGVCASVQTRH